MMKRNGSYQPKSSIVLCKNWLKRLFYPYHNAKLETVLTIKRTVAA
jgi:predicted homoserine dehydrogenase-like protein